MNIKIFRNIFLLVGLFFFSSCIQKSKIDISINPRKAQPFNITVSNVRVVNHQIIITGTNLTAVSGFAVVEGSNNFTMQIESKTATSIIANTISNVSFAAGKVFDFILSNASAASTFTVDFSLCDSTLGTKGFNCAITPNDKEVLAYDAVSGKWKPRAVNGLSYQGAWDAGTALPAATTAGDYYIVSVAAGAYNVGDWIVYNGATFDQINNSTVITNVFGRTGAITATKGDYILTKMGDVDLTTVSPATNDVLKYDGTNWVPGTVAAAGGGTVTSVSGTAPVSVATGTTTPVISMAAATTAVNGYLTSADWNTFNNKQASITAGTVAQYYRGDKSFQTLDTSVVPENTNLYFTNARTLGVALTGFDNTLAGAITATDTVLQAFGRTQKQINGLTTGSGNYLLKNAADTLSGAVSLTNVITATVTGDVVVNSVPLTLTSAVNKTYVDTADALKLAKAGDTMSGVLTLDSDLKIKGGNANYVTVKGHATTAAYNFILPSSAGTSGYVLQTDGAGNLSWINPAGVAAGSGTVDSTSIVDGTIVNADINATAAIAQSKIANLTTDLAAKQTTTLANGNILVGSAGNVATAVAMSGDATIVSSGAVTLKNTGTAGTYTSVTTDAQGRVTAGTNPVVVTSVTATAPVTVAGTAAIPLIAMPVATTAVDGYLAATDWTIFNNKQAAITSASTLNTGSITTNLQGGVVINPYGVAATNTGEIRFNELAANGANYVALKSPDALAANVTYTLPATGGTSGQVLTTDGTALTPTLSWVTPTAAPVTSVNGATGVVVLSTTNIAEGTNLYYTDARTIAAPLTGFSTGANSTILSTDTVLAAFQKAQGQIAAREPTITAGTTAQYLRGDKSLATFATDVRATVLTGLSTATNAVIAAADTALVAFGKLQAQISANGTSISGKADTTNVAQTITALSVTGLSAPVAGSDAANKTYVDGFGQWLKGVGGNAADIYFSTGNVGIGTAAPGQKLSVVGTIESTSGGIKFPDGSIQTTSATGGTNNSMVSGWPDAIVCTLTTPNYGSIVFEAAWMPYQADGLYYYDRADNGGTLLEIVFNANGTFNSYRNITTSNCNVAMSTNTSSGRTFNFAKGPAGQWLQNGLSAYYNAGSVGIGTNTPATKLDVTGTIRATTKVTVGGTTGGGYLDVRTDNGFTNAFQTLSELSRDTGSENGVRLGYFADGATDTAGAVLANGANPLALGTNGTEYARITNTGFMGIGTKAPTSKLHIVGSGDNGLNPDLVIDNGAATQESMIGFNSNGTRKWLMGLEDSDDGTTAAYNFSIFDFENLAFRFVINKTNGFVGIGTETPTYNLHVVGTAGLSTGTAWTNASDIRLKDIQGDYKYGLDEVLKLHTVRYNYKKDNPLNLPSDFTKTGFIAQEVQKVIPEAVHKRDDGYLELNVDPIHWAVVNAIQDLYRKYIEPLLKRDLKQDRVIASLREDHENLRKEKDREILQLKNENAILKKQNDKIQDRLNKIEKLLLRKD